MSTELQTKTKLQAVRLAQRPVPWSQQRLIFELERAAAALGKPIASRASLKVYVSRWENGHGGISADYRALFRYVYRLTDEDLGISDAIPSTRNTGLSEFPDQWTDSVQRLAETWRWDLERRSFLRNATFGAAASTTPVLRWLLLQHEDQPRANGTIPVGKSRVAVIREMSATFRVMDNRYGGGHIREPVVRFLEGDVAPLLKDGRFDSATGRHLLAATAEMTQLVGWMSYDEGYHGLAQHYLIQALRLAQAAQDLPLGAEILSAMSHQATYLGDGRSAIDLAQAARRTAVDAGVPALVAEASVLEAHGQASCGNEAACVAALSTAERALDKADRSNDPHWISYFDEAYLSAKFGHCFKELRQPAQAKHFAHKSLTMDNAYVRGRAFNLSLLATAHAQAKEVQEACAVGVEAARLVDRLKSRRASGYMKALRQELEPFRLTAEVQDFDQQTSAALAQTV